MTRSALISVLAATATVAGAAPAAAATHCVGGGKGCHKTIQAALDAAHDGDTIKVAPGTYAGGIAIDKSVRRARRRRARDHDPRRRAGRDRRHVRRRQPADRLDRRREDHRRAHAHRRRGRGLRARSAAACSCRPARTSRAGASLTIRDSVISGNRAVPRATSDSPSGVTCPDGPCPYAEGDGGGIASFGTLKVARQRRQRQRGRRAGGQRRQGRRDLQRDRRADIDDSKLVRNRAFVRAPNGRFAEAGGLLVENDAAGRDDPRHARSATTAST